jgi:hypothetical protein
VGELLDSKRLDIPPVRQTSVTHKPSAEGSIEDGRTPADIRAGR